MRASTHRLMPVAVVLVLAAGSLFAQGTGLVAGRVTDERGISIEGVMVGLSGAGIMGTRWTITDQEGLYHFPGITGTHPVTVQAKADGRVPMSYRGYTVKRDGVVSIDFTLRQQGHHQILVLVEEGIPYHDMALQGALPFLPGDTSIVRVAGNTAQDARKLRTYLRPRPSAVLALGETAARLARRHIRDVPVVYAMVPAPREADLSTRNLCGVPLLGGFAAQLEHLRHAAPTANRIGTIYDPSRMRWVARELREAAREAGMTLVEGHAHGEGAPAVAEGLAQLAFENLDAFILLLDPKLMDASGFARIVEFVESRRILMAAPDPSLAVTENSFAFGPTFREMGILAGHLVRRVARGQAQPWQIGQVFPERSEDAVALSAAIRDPDEILPPVTTTAALRSGPGQTRN